nr:hypothetical protein [Actinomycetota bacterium]
KVTDKQAQLAVFVAGHTDGDWPDVMRLWNEKFPKWRYKDAETFQREAVSSRRALLDPY